MVSIYCELGGRHHLPHCHLRWGDKEAVVSLTTIQVLVGDGLPPRGRAILIENAELLLEKWKELNSRSGGSEKPRLAHRKQGKK